MKEHRIPRADWSGRGRTLCGLMVNRGRNGFGKPCKRCWEIARQGAVKEVE